MVDQHTIYTTMLNSVIQKYGTQLNTERAADALSISTRKLDDMRKAGISPAYIEGVTPNSKGYMYPATAIVEWQIARMKRQVVTV